MAPHVAPAGSRGLPALPSEPHRDIFRLHGPAVFTGIALVAVAVPISGLAAFSMACFVWFLFGLPGIVLLYPTGPLHWPTVAATSLAGMAASLFGIALLGMALGRFGPVVAVAVPVALTAIAVGLRGRSQAAPLRIPREHDPKAIFTAVWFAVAMVALPYLVVGKIIDGDAHYTAFFNADFFKHLANTHALLLGALPPGDPFSAGNALHYYWLYYLLPATGVDLSGGSLNAQDVLLAFGLLQTTLMCLLFYGVCRLLGASASASAVAVVLGVLSLSYDGLASVAAQPGLSPVEAFTATNMEALDLTTALGFLPAHIAGSTLYRLSLYVPQHQLAIMFLASWALLFLAAHRKNQMGPPAGVRSVFVLVLPATSLITGVMSLLVMGMIEVHAWLKQRSAFPWAFAVAVPAAVALCLWGGIIGMDIVRQQMDMPGYAQARMGEGPPAWAWPLYFVPQTVTTFGPIAVFGLWGAWLCSRRSQQSCHGRPLPAVVVGAALATMLAVAMLVANSRIVLEVQLKVSHVASFGMVLGSAIFFTWLASLKRSRLSVYLLCAVLIAPGSLSPFHDWIWHGTLLPGWTVRIPREDLEALQWIRRHTEPDAVFLQYPEPPFLQGGRDAWIPIISGRAILSSSRSLVQHPQSIDMATRFFQGVPVDGAADVMAGAAHFDYLYVSRALTPAAYEGLNRKLDGAGFARVFANGGVAIWAAPGDS